MTLPAVLWRLIFAVVGIRSYLPYQLAVIVAHLVVVVLLRVIMRRAGVGPWLSTLAAASLLLFGAGMADIVNAFQITFVGAFLFGLVQLILSDHDGPIDRRDRIGLLAGAAGLMCSGIGVTMVIVVGISTLLRRGRRAAAFHVLPLAALYLLWYGVERPKSMINPYHQPLTTMARQMFAFDFSGLVGTFRTMGSVPFAGLAVAAVLVVGLVLAWTAAREAGTSFRRHASVPLAMLAGLVIFLTITGLGRWYLGSDYAQSSRYLYLTAAFALPATALGADAIVKRWRFMIPVLGVLLVLSVVGNTLVWGRPSGDIGPVFTRHHQLIVALAQLHPSPAGFRARCVPTRRSISP